jgi:hypothetical protein
MGRPLKIKKSTTIDIGFNNFGNLTAAQIPTGLSSTEFIGVVGGANTNIATSSYPVVLIGANVNGVVGNAYIIRQKGTTKYLVGAQDTVTANVLTPGYSYVITSLGTTNWTAIGATTSNPNVGDIFTATAASTNGSGTASDVGICVLTNQANTAALTSGQMNMLFSYDGDVANVIPVQRLKNKFILSYANTEYAATFFDTGNTTPKSGAETATWGTNGSTQNSTGTLTTGLVQNYTS